MAAFGVGTILAMSGFAALIGWVARRFASRGQALYRGLLIGFGLVAIAVGILWLGRLL